MIHIPETEPVEVITIVAASELWRRLQPDLVGLGVRRYTFEIEDGFAQHGLLKGSFVREANVRIETHVSSELLMAILAHVRECYPCLLREQPHTANHDLLARGRTVVDLTPIARLSRVDLDGGALVLRPPAAHLYDP
jgi:hypothetical protein